VPLALRREVQPGADALQAQAITFAQYGLGSRAAIVRKLPTSYGADTAVAESRPVFALGPNHEIAIAVPVLDEGDHVTGVLVSAGARRATRWYPAQPGPGPRWGAVLSQLRPSEPGTARDASVALGPVRVLPAMGALAFVQPAYAWHLEGPPQLVQTAVLVADSLRAAPTLQSVAGTAGAAALGAPADFRGAVEQLYDAMRRAVREGDWAGFGRAFDSLGTLLRRSRR
jgi:hypothetical protein